jgi:hypothetical protein
MARRDGQTCWPGSSPVGRDDHEETGGGWRPPLAPAMASFGALPVRWRPPSARRRWLQGAGPLHSFLISSYKARGRRWQRGVWTVTATAPWWRWIRLDGDGSQETGLDLGPMGLDLGVVIFYFFWKTLFSIGPSKQPTLYMGFLVLVHSNWYYKWLVFCITKRASVFRTGMKNLFSADTTNIFLVVYSTFP